MTNGRTPTSPTSANRKGSVLQRKRTATPLVITPRSSSIDRQRLSPPISSLAIDQQKSSPLESSSTLHSGRDFSPTISREKKDIMDIPDIRASCIRVHDINNQSHIIKITGFEDTNELRRKIFQKFNVVERHELFVIHPSDDKSLQMLSDQELTKIVRDPNNKNRGNLILRKIIGAVTMGSEPTNLELRELERRNTISPTEHQRIMKLQNFFGSPQMHPTLKSPKHVLLEHPMNIQENGKSKKISHDSAPNKRSQRKSKRINGFFGERYITYILI